MLDAWDCTHRRLLDEEALGSSRRRSEPLDPNSVQKGLIDRGSRAAVTCLRAVTRTLNSANALVPNAAPLDPGHLHELESPARCARMKTDMRHTYIPHHTQLPY